MGEFVTATYLIETPYTLEHAANVIAAEQSTGTFTAVPGETEELKHKFRARIKSIREVGVAESPALPGALLPVDDRHLFTRGMVQLEYPFHNFGPSIPNLLATVAGNLLS